MPHNPIAYSYLDVSQQRPEADAYNFAALMHWPRHGESLSVTATKDSKERQSAGGAISVANCAVEPGGLIDPHRR